GRRQYLDRWILELARLLVARGARVDRRRRIAAPVARLVPSEASMAAAAPVRRRGRPWSAETNPVPAVTGRTGSHEDRTGQRSHHHHVLHIGGGPRAAGATPHCSSVDERCDGRPGRASRQSFFSWHFATM